MAKQMVPGIIYKAIGGPHDDERPEFGCYCPAAYAADCVVGDCWVCDDRGNLHPGYNVSPVPIAVERLGETVGRMA